MIYILPTSIILYVILFISLYNKGIKIINFTIICVIRLTKRVLNHVLNIPIVSSLLRQIKANGEIMNKNIIVTYLIAKLIKIEILPKEIIPFIIPFKLKRSEFIISSILTIFSFKLTKDTFLPSKS